MLAEKINAALSLLSGTKSAGILRNSKQIIDLIKKKLPENASN